jgi:hypothetical protein
MTMGDIAETSAGAPVPVENVRGMGVAGPPVEQLENEVEEDAAQADAVQRESTDLSEEAVGRNIDVEA